MKNPEARSPILLLALLTVGMFVWGVLSMSDQRTGGEKIGDAIDGQARWARESHKAVRSPQP